MLPSFDPQRVKAICFDVDGTIRDTDDQYTHSLTRLVSPIRFILPARDPHRFARWVVMRLEGPMNSVHGLSDRLHLDDELLHLTHLLSMRKSHQSSKDYLIIPGVKPTLESLAERYLLAVVSARDQHGTLAFLDHFGLTSLFTCIATALTTRYTKPKPDPVLWAARQMNVSPESCLMVGDTTVDIRAGRAAGAQTVGVLCGFGEEAELKRNGANIILPSTANLIELLSNHYNLI